MLSVNMTYDDLIVSYNELITSYNELICSYRLTDKASVS